MPHYPFPGASAIALAAFVAVALPPARAQNYYTTASTTSGTMNVAVYVPEGVDNSNLRGVILYQNGDGEDRRFATKLAWTQGLARSLRYAVVTTKAASGDSKPTTSNATDSANNWNNILVAAGAISGRTNLVNAPYLATGMSRGAIHSPLLANHQPARMLGFVSNKGGNNGAAGSLGVPGTFIVGEDDGNGITNPGAVQPQFINWRGQGTNTGRVAFAVDYDVPHLGEAGQGWDYTAALFGEYDRLRHPGTALTALPALNEIPYANGWLAARAVFSTGTTLTTRPTYPEIAPVASFTGAASNASWLPSEAAARVYRAFTNTESARPNLPGVPRNTDLRVTMPARFQEFLPGAPVLVAVDPRGLLNVTSMKFYLDGTLLGEKTAAPWTWDLGTGVASGPHSVVVEASDGAKDRAAFVTFTVSPRPQTLLPALVNTWTGGAGTGAMQTAANWSGAIAGWQDVVYPVGTFKLTKQIHAFDGAAANGQFNVSFSGLGSRPVFAGFEFKNAPGANGFTVGGNNALTLGAGGIVNLDDSTQTIGGSQIYLGSLQTWSAVNGDLLVSPSTLIELFQYDNNSVWSFGGLTLHAAGGRTITLATALAGEGYLIKDGAGTAVLNAAGTWHDGKYGQLANFTETLRIHDGVFRLGASGSLRDTTRLFVAPVAGAVLDLNGKAVTVASLNGGGTVALGTGGSLTLGNKYTEGALWPDDVRFQGAITGGTSNQDSLVFNGNVTWEDIDGGGTWATFYDPPVSVLHCYLGGAGTYLGRTRIQNNSLRLTGSGGLGATGPGNETIIESGALFYTWGSGIYSPEDIVFNTPAFGTAMKNASVSTGTNTLAGTIRIPTTATNSDINIDNEGVNSTLRFAGVFTGTDYAGSGGVARAFFRGGQGATFDFTGEIRNPVNGVMSVFTRSLSGTPSANTFRFAGASTFTGGLFHLGGTLRIAANAPSGSPGALGNSTGGVTLGTSWGTGAGESLAALSEGNVTIARGFTVASDITGWTGTVTFGAADAATGTWSGTLSSSAKELVLTAPAGGSAIFIGLIEDGAGSVGITKTGAGRVVLGRSGGNTYDGGTVVSGGLLVAANASGSATGTGAVTVQSGAALGGGGVIAGVVTLQTGAKLAADLATTPGAHDRLDVGGALALNDTVIELTATGGAPAAGTYTLLQAASITGAPGAVVAPSGFTGTAAVVGNQVRVTLASALSPLESWRVSYFGSSANSGNGADVADPDGDGAPNLLEYALGTLPSAATSVAVPVAQVSGSRLQVSFTRVRSDVTYFVESSPDLSAWTNITYTPVTLGQTQTVSDTVDLPTATPPRRFLRLRVTSP